MKLRPPEVAFLLGCLLTLAPVPSALAAPPTKRDEDFSVVMVVLDGVRWQEVFHGTDPALGSGQRPLFTYLRETMGPQGILVSDAEVSNDVFLSLPAYQSLLSGRRPACRSNRCGRVEDETLPERLVRELDLDRRDGAVLASWASVGLAAEHERGAILVNVGQRALEDGTEDPSLDAINAAQADDPPPWGHARLDRYTMAHALRYLRVHRPRFLFVALNDADEWAHQGNYAQYVKTLDVFDTFLAQLVVHLDALEVAGRRTLLVVTTDHGRGAGSAWTEHGNDPDAARVWMYLRMSGRAPPSSWPRRFAHADLRPTLEAILGLRPVDCAACGRTLGTVVSWAREPVVPRFTASRRSPLAP